MWTWKWFIHIIIAKTFIWLYKISWILMKEQLYQSQTFNGTKHLRIKDSLLRRLPSICSIRVFFGKIHTWCKPPKSRINILNWNMTLYQRDIKKINYLWLWKLPLFEKGWTLTWYSLVISLLLMWSLPLLCDAVDLLFDRRLKEFNNMSFKAPICCQLVLHLLWLCYCIIKNVFKWTNLTLHSFDVLSFILEKL